MSPHTIRAGDILIGTLLMLLGYMVWRGMPHFSLVSLSFPPTLNPCRDVRSVEVRCEGTRRKLGIVARISETPPLLFPSIIRINKGREDGMEEGMAVSVGNELFGRVIKAEKKSSLVMTFWSNSFYVDVSFRRSKERAILRGDGRGKLEIVRTLKGLSIPEGDVALTSGATGKDPKGFIVGQKVGKKVVPKADISKVLYVSVITAY